MHNSSHHWSSTPTLSSSTTEATAGSVHEQRGAHSSLQVQAHSTAADPLTSDAGESTSSDELAESAVSGDSDCSHITSDFEDDDSSDGVDHLFGKLGTQDQDSSWSGHQEWLEARRQARVKAARDKFIGITMGGGAQHRTTTDPRSSSSFSANSSSSTATSTSSSESPSQTPPPTAAPATYDERLRLARLWTDVSTDISAAHIARDGAFNTAFDGAFNTTTTAGARRTSRATR